MIHLYSRAGIVGKMRYFFLDRHYNVTVRTLLVGLCLVATLLSAFLLEGIDSGASPIPGLIPILAIAGIAGLAFVYTHMELFGLMVLAVSMLVNDGIATGSGTKATFTFVLLFVWLFLWFFKMVAVEKHIRLRPTLAHIPIFLFCVVAVISFLWSGAYTEPGVQYLLDSKLAPRLMTTLVLIISPLTYLFYTNHIRSLNSLRFITWWFIGLGALYLVLELSLGTIPSPFNANGQFPTWVGVIALGQLLFNRQLTWWMRAGLGVIILGWLYITMTLGVTWLSGWLPLLVGVAAVVFFYSRKLFFVVLLITAGMFVISYAAIQENFARENEESGGTRTQAWQRVFDLTERHLVFGTGPAGYHFYFTTYLRGQWQLSHNNYVDILAQTGVAGFTLWLLLWGGIGVMTWRLYRVIPRMGGGFQQGFAIALVASYPCTLVTMALGDYITPFPYTQTLQGIDYTIWAWILPGLATAMYYITLENSQKDERPAAEDTALLLDSVPRPRPLLPPVTNPNP